MYKSQAILKIGRVFDLVLGVILPIAANAFLTILTASALAWSLIAEFAIYSPNNVMPPARSAPLLLIIGYVALSTGLTIMAKYSWREWTKTRQASDMKGGK